ncbi:hypothetical protein [Ralstonia pseudosolanacearum]|uniref:hypothetical protein n=1 Tax=Ralstonia pseudosolanacearum TaxID=1310165 RepID=UPI00126925E8|nr:hypothetical protein [Ralstonia pseudosolanacearum]MDO3558738.1 hypothetical protein [Ralstonia pseudosolanacearum]MDO3609095.1 hypothetical protein [Ralstonia pseudosolanacearum]MDO3614069.1 hypothetical protein [Ralstonia pseudosolanacearum]
MSALDHFLALTPQERLEAVLKANHDFPSDPHPALRCVSANPLEPFPSIEAEVVNEIGAYVRLLAHFGHIDTNNVEGVAAAGERYILALSVMRLRAIPGEQ